LSSGSFNYFRTIFLSHRSHLHWNRVAHLCLVHRTLLILILLCSMARDHQFLLVRQFLSVHFFTLNVLILSNQIHHVLFGDNILNGQTHLTRFGGAAAVLLAGFFLWCFLLRLSWVLHSHFLQLAKTFHHFLQNIALVKLFQFYWILNILDIFNHWCCIGNYWISMVSTHWYVNFFIFLDRIVQLGLILNEMLLV